MSEKNGFARTVPVTKFIEIFNMRASEKVWNVIYGIGCVLCAIPWLSLKNGQPVFPLVNRIYASFFIIGNIFVVVKFLIYKFENTRNNPIEWTLSISNMCVLAILHSTVIIRSLMNSNKMGKFVMIRVNITKSLRETSSKLFFLDQCCLQFILGHVVYGSVAYFLALAIGDQKGSILDWISFAVPEYYCLILTISTSHILLIITKGFHKENEKLVGISISHKENEILRDILQMEMKYLKIYEGIHLFNELHGWCLFLMFWHMLIQILRCANWIFYFHSESWWNLSPILVIALLRLVSI